ncbi:FecCD family ABC transporter permease [Propionibacterium australiense]|uniref:FecCD family ABC transporter permease n=1 Tax=Propionibacterium australiense TaxID=119981 RepID=UPI001E5C35BF|nr:iron chelate uptake ABC transporter family permease subunit [Propionibacterium australiense]
MSHIPALSAERRCRTVAGVLFGVAVIVLLAFVSMSIGSRQLTLAQVWEGLAAHDRSAASIIVWQLRLPRTVVAVVVGAALGAAGVVMQALTRNPLAEPGVLGVNAGASFAVVLAIAVGGVSAVSGYVWFSFIGSAAAALLVQTMARRRPGAGHARLVLAGVALAAALNAVTGTVTMYDTAAFDSYRFWTLGSFADRDLATFAWTTPFVAAGLLIALACGRSLNVLALGDEQATALGARLGLVRAASLTAITLLCGAATAAAGPIGFVGLVVPHVLRLVVGPDQRRLLPLSIVGGPILVLAADIAGRVITRPDEIEAGVVTAFVGAPVLLSLVVYRRGR